MSRIRGLVLILFGAAALASASASVAVAWPAGTRPQDPPAEPRDEESLWRRIDERLGKGERNQAAEDLERFLREYPESARIPDALLRLAPLEEQLGRRRQAAERYADFVRRFPKHERAADAQLGRAVSLRHQKRKEESKAAFLKLFRDYPGSNASQNGLWQYWSLENKSFQFGVNQSFTEGQPVTISAHFRNIDKVVYRVYRLDTSSLLEKVEAGAKFQSVQELIASVPAGARTKLREWTEEPAVGQNKWASVEVKPDIREAGLYIFQAEHDDIPVDVGIVVARMGLVVKSAPNRTLVFALDRRTGRAVAGMTLRFSEGDKRFEGKTDADGLFALDRGFSGAVVGVAEGEIALSNIQSNGSGDEAKSYIFTDRPIYRPFQTVHFKAIHRILKVAQGGGAAYENVAGRPDTITIRDPRGNVVYQKEHATNEFGSVTGEFRLGDEPPLGHYYVQTSLGGYGQFRVEEYRKPEYEVKVAYEGGPYLQGDDLKAEISVDYYFGSPVVDSDVSYEVRRRPHLRSPWRCFDMEWAWMDDGDDDDEMIGRRGRRGHWYGAEEVLSKGTGRTDRRGKLKVVFPTRKDAQDHVYSVVAKVVDRSRREVEGRASAKVARASLELSVSASKHLYTPGDQVNLKVRATDLDGRPVADKDIDLTASTAAWRHRGGQDGSGYDFGEFYTGTARTDANGIAEFSFPAEKEGYIRIRAAAKDRRGNEVADESWIWVSGRAWSANFQNFTGLQILPDKKLHRDGETARVLLTSQHKGIHVLFTVECDGIHRHEIVRIKGHSAIVEVPIDGKKFAPNVYFTATAVVANEFLSASESVTVPPADRFLTVKIRTDREKYRPRETAEVIVEVTDASGRPVVTELSIGMVDESIYALQKELVADVRKFFFARRWNRVATGSSMHYWDHGRAGAKPESAAAPSGDSLGRARKGLASEKESRDDAGMAETEVRGNFPDTMFWGPNAVTDAAGRFSFKTPVPDSLTTWRTTVRGVTADTRVGQATLETIVRKEVIVRLEAPRFFTQNDVCVVSGVVHNYRDDVDEVRVSLEAEGVEVDGPLEVVLNLAKGEDKRVDWRISAKKAGTARLTARALTPKESDAMRLDLPILPHGSPMIQARAGIAEGTIREKVTLSPSAIREASELMIVVSPSVASQVTDALEYLAGYPYGCVEQTMSRFLPSVVASRAMRKMGVKNDKLMKELPSMVAAGLQRLYNFQHGDGGWGWWEADESHPFMTAYVVYGLAKAREADHFVDTNVLQRGVECLRRMAWLGETGRRRGPEAPIDTRAYILFALSEAGAPDAGSLAELYGQRTELSDYGKALLAIALGLGGKAEEARTVLANLDESAKQGAAFCYWQGHSQRWHWMSHSIETTAYVLRAYALAAPKDAKIPKIVRWLAANRHGNRWHSTKDTAAIVYALSDYAAASGELDADYALTVRVNGKDLISAKVDRTNLLAFDGTRVLKGLDVAAGDTEIEFVREGKGVLYYSVFLKSFEAADTFKPVDGTVSIERSYARVKYDGKERVVEELKDGDEVVSGDLIEVTLKLDASGLHEYMMIEDPLPAGFEVQKQEERFQGGWHHRRWNWWYSRLEARDERVCIAATSLNGSQSVSYLMRAEAPGTFRVLPARAYNMYVPEIAGSSAGFRIRVKDR